MTIITDVPSEGPVEMKGASGKTLIRPPWMTWFKEVFLCSFSVQDSGTTAQRPTKNLWVGRRYFDTTLDVPVWYDGTQWVSWTSSGSTGISEVPRWVILGGSDSLSSHGIQGADISVSANQLGGSQSNSNVLSSQKRTVFAVGTDALVIGFATTNASAAAKNGIFRNSTGNQGSFYLRVLFGVEQKGVNPDSFCCCLGSAPTSVSSITTAPSTGITDCFGFVKDRGDTNWQVVRRTGSGGVTKTDLGLAPAAGQIFFVEFLSSADASSIRLKVSRIDSASTLVDTTYTTTLPDPTASLALYLAGVASGTGNTGVAIIGAQFYESKLTIPTPLAF